MPDCSYKHRTRVLVLSPQDGRKYNPRVLGKVFMVDDVTHPRGDSFATQFRDIAHGPQHLNEMLKNGGRPELFSMLADECSVIPIIPETLDAMISN